MKIYTYWEAFRRFGRTNCPPCRREKRWYVHKKLATYEQQAGKVNI